MVDKKADIMFEYFERLFPNPKCELNFSTPFEMLVAVVLSVQCTDVRVNMVTKELFKKYKTPKDFANMKQEDLENIIRSTGFFRNKARNIIKMSQQLLENYNGEIPHDAREMENLAGVGRKVANVVASIAFGAKELGVDTHIFRVLNRIGLVNANTPEKTELQFVQKYPDRVNHDTHYRILLFGRYKCTAKNPKCAECELQSICEYYKKEIKNNQSIKK